MTRKTLLVLTVLCIAVGLMTGFAGSAGAANAPADDGGTVDASNDDPACTECSGGGGGGDDGGGGGGCSGGPNGACAEL